MAFGTDPDRLSPELKKAASTRALKERSPKRIEAVRAARTNLELFTAWPVGAGARNSINDEDSLLRVMCGADDTEKCEGPMARFAEFRTESGTWDRMVGLIVVLVPMVPLWVILAVTAVLMMAAQVMVVIRTVQLLFVAALSTAGKAGTERVVSYAGELLGDLLAAFKHAAFLALVLVVWRLFSAEVGTGAIGQWMVLAVALVVLLIKREALWGFARNRPQQNAGAALATRMAAAWAVRSAARSATGGASAVPGVAMKALGRGGTGRRSGSGGGRAGRLLRAATAGPMAPHLAATAGNRHAAPATPVASSEVAATAVPAASGRAPDRAGAGVVPMARRAEVPASADRLGQARADRARRVRAVMDERDALIAQRRLTPDGQAAERTRLARQRGDLARTAELRAVERDPRKRHAMRKREVSLQRRIDASQRRLEQSDAAARRAGEPAAARRRQANQWLREQATLPSGQQPATAGAGGRNYPVLAAVAGSSVAEYRGATSLQQAAIRAKVDRELTRHRQDGRVIAKDLARNQRDRGAPPTAASRQGYRKDAGRQTDRRPGRAS
ncbi:hypothetical protein GKE82_24980 [Conexibacter sp. W3-3-2]|uniref:hypothetical protein n=1 Tax=Conexibacter sp. W3-3-2 TaxID=2675227 RepID=UPI0012B8939C|nr:hypothetical protein [Conexibacter sp. W3-3-2]MTD47461.1 hypothetical protein [Conexibacter sp. W3-3-2]